MKKIIALLMLFALTGCNTNNNEKTALPTTSNEIVNVEQEKETITLNEYGFMNENNVGYYELIYNDEISFEVNNDYLTNEFALEFDRELILVDYETCHLSGEFRYSYDNKDYVVKLNEINIGFFYMGVGGENFFQIDVKRKQIRYWLYSKGNATLVINKVWRYVPYAR